MFSKALAVCLLSHKFQAQTYARNSLSVCWLARHVSVRSFVCPAHFTRSLLLLQCWQRVWYSGGGGGGIGISCHRLPVTCHCVSAGIGGSGVLEVVISTPHSGNNPFSLASFCRWLW